jgi:hypothetical protein
MVEALNCVFGHQIVHSAIISAKDGQTIDKTHEKGSSIEAV